MVVRCIVAFEIVASIALSLVLNCGAVGTDASDILPNDTLVVTAYQTLSELYVDGIIQTIVNGNTWAVPDYIAISSSSRLVAVAAVNLGSPSCSGVLASVHSALLLTNSTWKCSAQNQANWFGLGFDDSSWLNAVEYGDNLNGHSCDSVMKVADISPEAKWIWTNNIFDLVIYCRGYTNAKPDDTLAVTAYQTLQNVYVDGITQTISNGGTWSAPDYLPISSNSRLVAVHAVNLGNPICAGILASIQPDLILTDSKWKCSPTNPAGWSGLGFDDSSWTNAVEYGDNLNGHNTCPDAMKVVDISQDAKWIWGNDVFLQIVIYCRGYTGYCDKFSPCLNGGTCLQNNQALCQCLPQFTGEFCEIEMSALEHK